MTVLTRRNAFRAGAGAIAAGVAGMKATSALAGEDPVLTLYRQYLDFEERAELGERELTRLRSILVERYGDPTHRSWGGNDALHCDPLHVRWIKNDEAQTALNDAQSDLVDELMATQATTREGLRIKLKLLQERMETEIDLMDTTESMPFYCLNDCLHLLGEGTI